MIETLLKFCTRFVLDCVVYRQATVTLIVSCNSVVYLHAVLRILTVLPDIIYASDFSF